MIAILGGGISGLAAAYELQKAGKDFILLEAENHLGGKIKSTSIEGFQLEMGPNTVLINNTEIKTLIDELELFEKDYLIKSLVCFLPQSQLEELKDSIDREIF